MTIGELSSATVSTLTPLYGEGEARWLTRIALEHFSGLTRTDLLLKADNEASPTLADSMARVTGRLKRFEPLQYILGETYWHGLTLKVTPAVLIPREETSELIDIIADDCAARSDLSVVDLCTGSGCISIALARALPFSKVTATDISEEALAVARENADECKAKITFLQGDLLAGVRLPDGSADVIVSNPPYIGQSEAAGMSANVLDYEPHLALFVPDDDPLRFYKVISREGLRIGAPGARLYLEINPLHASATVSMLELDGWTEVTPLRDIHGKLRFIKAIHNA